MIALPLLIHYLVGISLVIISIIGVSIGQGLIGKSALNNIDVQPQAKQFIQRACILGSAILETSAIIGLLASLMLLLGTDPATLPPYAWLGELGIACALCIPCIVGGIASSMPAQAAAAAIARQPFSSQKILNFMLITQTFIQTPVIFGLVIFLIISNQLSAAATLGEGLWLFSCGLSLGLGSIGPAFALGNFSKTACNAIGFNRELYSKIFSFTLISQAIIETPIIFSLAVSLLLTLNRPTEDIFLSGISMLTAACCMGICTIMPSISSSRIASTACREIAKSPEQFGTLSRVSLIAQGLIDTIPIYALLISLILIFV